MATKKRATADQAEVIARINAELEGEGSNPDEETVLTTTDEIAQINAALVDKSAKRRA